MFRSITKMTVALATLLAMAAPAQASFYSVDAEPSQQFSVADDFNYVTEMNLVNSIDLAYANGELSYDEAQFLVMMARQQGATAAQIWNWLKGFVGGDSSLRDLLGLQVGDVMPTITLGFRCLKAWGARFVCTKTSLTDESREKCNVKYFPTILNNCIARQD